MTYQIRDSFILNGENYLLVHIQPKGHRWFSPYHYGFNPYYNCTACWSGYQCSYTIKDNILYLTTLNINNKGDNYPIFEGVVANTTNPYWHFNASYNDIFLDFKFTGKVLIAKDVNVNIKMLKKWNIKMYSFLTYLLPLELPKRLVFL